MVQFEMSKNTKSLYYVALVIFKKDLIEVVYNLLFTCGGAATRESAFTRAASGIFKHHLEP